MRPLLLSGGPAAGKTTCARALAAGRPRAAYIDADDVRQLVVAGDAPPWSGAEGRTQNLLAARNVALLAESLLAAGFDVTASDVLTTEALSAYRAELPECFVVHLTISIDAARSRADTRPRWITDDEFDLLHRMTRTPPAVDLVLDVSDMSEHEQIDAVREAWTRASLDSGQPSLHRRPGEAGAE